MVFRAQKPVSNFPVSLASFSEEMASFRSLFSPKGEEARHKGAYDEGEAINIYHFLSFSVGCFFVCFRFHFLR